MNSHHPKGLRYTMTILRSDGTYWVKEHVKHVIIKPGFVVVYEGEHGVDRVQSWIPNERIDHFTLEEERKEQSK